MRQRHHTEQQKQQAAQCRQCRAAALFGQIRVYTDARFPRKKQGKEHRQHTGGFQMTGQHCGCPGYGTEGEHGTDHPQAFPDGVGPEHHEQQAYREQRIHPAEQASEAALLQTLHRDHAAALKA